jgi:2-hydroxychromene-2-carboxylate isomerase
MFDYRCPLARNASEHIVTAVKAGAPFDVSFRGFSLSQIHVEEGAPPVWGDPAKRPELTALAAGLAVRDSAPEQFLDAHLSLFAVRHDDGDDLRDEVKIHNALVRAGVDADAIFKELEQGWPYELLQAEHEAAVASHSVWGVPTFISGTEAVFVRLMTRPKGDADLARSTVELVLGLLEGHPELNEYKHTTIPR